MPALRDLNEDEFTRNLADFVRPSKAVTSAQHLHGRDNNLRQARTALRTEGTQVFIFGERGVGKTSLAKTLLQERVADHARDLLIACEKNSTFNSIISAIAKRILPILKSKSSQSNFKAAFQAFGFSVEYNRVWEVADQLIPDDINSFISFLKSVDKVYPVGLTFILDEFDLIESIAEKQKFAELVKQLSDQEIESKLIICGISNDVQILIGGHFSSGRYIEPIQLGPLTHGATLNILDKACDAFGVSVDKEARLRSSLIADGYPYFMHLITKNALEIIYENPSLPYEITENTFEHAVRRSVSKAEPMLKTAYDLATKRYSNQYEPVLWSVAALTLFENRWDDIYEKAYRTIVCPALRTQLPLSKENFYKRLLNLTREATGKILSTNKNGWYSFSENVVRSYVRLRASENGIDLGIDLHGKTRQFRPEPNTAVVG